MIKPPTEELLESMITVRNDSRFRAIWDYFREALEHQRQGLTTADEDKRYRRLQGSAQTLQDIIDLDDKAREKLDALRQATPPAQHMYWTPESFTGDCRA